MSLDSAPWASKLVERLRRLPRAKPPGEGSAVTTFRDKTPGMTSCLYQVASSSVTTNVIGRSLDTLLSNPFAYLLSSSCCQRDATPRPRASWHPLSHCGITTECPRKVT